MVSSEPTAGTDPAEGTPPAGAALPPTAMGSVTVTRVPVVPEPLAIGAVTLISVVLSGDELPLEDDDPLAADPPPAAIGAVTSISVAELAPLVEAAPPPSAMGAVTLISVLVPLRAPVVTPLPGTEP
jgi:hypothetical protein